MDLKLTNKVALVTGSTAGIGFATARALAIEGAHVYVNGRTQERVDAAMAAIFVATELAPEEAGAVAELEAVLVVTSCPPAVTNDAGEADAALRAAATWAVAVVVVDADAVVEPRLGTDAGAPAEPVLM